MAVPPPPTPLGPLGSLQNVGSREGKTILVTERAIIHVCGQSTRKHGAVIRITTLMGNSIISH